MCSKIQCHCLPCSVGMATTKTKHVELFFERTISDDFLGNLNSRPGRCGASLRKKRLQTLPEFPVIAPRVSFSLEYVKCLLAMVKLFLVGSKQLVLNLISIGIYIHT